jgi:DNA-binding MarR family transcriptional regulator
MVSSIRIDQDHLENYLGTPSAQRILRILACWEKLPVKDIIKLSGLSQSQVHATLRNLEEIKLITREERGIYIFSGESFPQHLKEAYQIELNMDLGQQLYDIEKNLDDTPANEVVITLANLIKQWKPFLEHNYHRQLSSLAEYLVDTV